MTKDEAIDAIAKYGLVVDCRTGDQNLTYVTDGARCSALAYHYKYPSAQRATVAAIERCVKHIRTQS